MEAAMSLRWNLADLFELVADAVPERLALAHGEKGRTRSFAELEARANALATHLARGHRPGEKLAIYSHNRPEFVEALLAALKARLVPVNVNYRYREDELVYLFDNSDATAVVYEASFAREVAALRDRVAVREWIELADGAPGNAFAEPYEEIAAGSAARLELRRSPDDLILLYTGGTTGMPKGVMWEHGALWRALGGGGSAVRGEAPSESAEEHRARVRREENAVRLLPGCPLMHGTGQFMTYTVMASGGAVVTLEGRGLDAHELWRTVSARRVQTLAIVGDAFAKPMLRALEERPGAYDLGCVRHIVSSGVMWSPPVKRALLEHLPEAVLQDSFGSSEAVGFGLEITTRSSSVQLGRFRIGPNCKVFTPDGEEVAPGSGVAGFIARTGPIPAGYYKDEAKTAETFRVLQGRRWSIPGDWCTVNADGTLELLGRGSVCINTGGEKVHPEEVEEALKLHPSVADAVVVGLRDEQWGEAVTGVVELKPGAQGDEAALREFVRRRLAGYKVPKRIVFVDSVGRSPSGKADYKGAKAKALAAAPRGD
jgi:fatty-acyl-CoA synthase